MPRQLRLIAVLISAILFSLISLAQSTLKQVLPLNTGWEFRQIADAAGADAPVWRPAQVPGDVHLDLLRNKLIPDPFYRDNEAKLQWIENADWEYRTTIQAPPDLLSHKNIELVFEGLDAYAEVYINEKLVLTADNMFREWRVDA
jgi:beta-mannosidase